MTFVKPATDFVALPSYTTPRDSIGSGGPGESV